MDQVVADKDNGYADTIKKLRAKYDFAELKSDKVAKAYLDFLTGSWTADGADELLKTNAEEWQETYDAAVKIKAAKGGVDVAKNLSAVDDLSHTERTTTMTQLEEQAATRR